MITDDDRRLLIRPLLAMITVAPKGDRWPAPRPVWFEVTDAGDIQIFSFANSPRVDRLREQPRASVVVAAPVGEPEHWVALEGSVEMTPDGAFDLATRLGAHYWGEDAPANQHLLDEWGESELVRIVVHPERVQRFTV